MLQTDTFILNTIGAGAFFVFLLLGLLLLFFKRFGISPKNYRLLCGVALVVLALNTLFIDVESMVITPENADKYKLYLVLFSFTSILVTFVYALNSSKYETVDAVQKFVQQQPQVVKTVEQPEEVASEPQKHPEEQSAVQPATETPKEVSTEQPAEEQETIDQPSEQESSEQVAEQVTAETETAQDEAVQAEVSTEDSSNMVDAETEEDSKDAAPIDNTNIDDLIFFQKVEALMASKRLFCEQDINREQIASAIGTNRTYLARSIKNATGKTFLEYITDLRTSFAATLLTTTDEPLDVIGTISGFGSKSAYYRAFSAAYGCSPSEYRKR